ncbi:TonB family protein [Hymenobacter cellulosilyticus]|uniref:Energy transducer TonB n=1 Tax=Hymenobacter cellulosilyticus TaxID=2932248 RepID=A0A8T9Q6L6_9BACT|nr:TonB family protein [Hymenobacter cellulosilyticus]UOQ72602.1 energy transducer TonB [Hymenobacter cellulosilyticus]
MLGLLALCLAGPTAVRAQSKPKADSTVYTYVEKMPQFGKEPADLLTYIGKNIKYPAAAIMDRAQGTVFVGFTVGLTGQVEDVHIVKTAHPSLDAAALQMVRSMPAWEPGIQGGKPARVAYTVPVTFRFGQGTKDTQLPPPTNAEFAGSAEELHTLLNAPPYPEAARKAGASGKAVVVFEVSKTGQILNPHALTPLSETEQSFMHQKSQVPPLHPALLAAAEAQIGCMRAWKPATTSGSSVASFVMLPVTYRLAATPAPDTVYAVTDQLPEFPGGIEAMTGQLARSIQYPKEARQEQAEGEVLLYFVVNKLGKVEQAEVLRSVHPAIDAEALRVIKTLPAFAPAMHHGHPAKVAFLLPLPFVLPSASVINQPTRFAPALSKKFVYPTEALRLGIQGKVFLDFSFDSTGYVHNVRVTNGLHPLLDAEAVAALEHMAPVSRARALQLNGQSFSVPISFKLPANADRLLVERYANEGLQPAAAFKPAEYPGGPAALQAFLAAASYPAMARAQQVSGRIFMTLTIDEAGWVKKIEPFHSSLAAATTTAAKARTDALNMLYEAARQYLMEMPQWKPALWNGKAFASTITVPLTYSMLPPSTPEPVVYTYADEMPVPAAPSVAAASSHRLMYPEAALRARAEGIVWVYFVVDEQGQVVQPAIISSPHPSLEAEALKLIGGLRKYTPGRHGGKPVKVAVVTPVPFTIR